MQINARGLSCPQPVLLTKNAVDNNEKDLEILVDDGAPKENVTRFLENSSYKVEIKEEEDGYIIIGRK